MYSQGYLFSYFIFKCICSLGRVAFFILANAYNYISILRLSVLQARSRGNQGIRFKSWVQLLICYRKPWNFKLWNSLLGHTEVIVLVSEDRVCMGAL